MGIIKKMNKLNQHDPFVIKWSEAIQAELDTETAEAQQISRNVFFDECEEKVLAYYEKEAGTQTASTSLDDRRSAVMAKWLSSNVPSLAMVQQVADAWNDGKVSCAYDKSNLTINVRFIDKGVPTGLADLKEAIENVIPAHLAVSYVVEGYTWNDIKDNTWSFYSNTSWEELTGGEY